MKLLKHLFVLFLLISIASCKSDVKKEVDSVQQIANIKHIEVNIEGMTCEIGCAKLIESKVHKLEGVTFSKVSFEEKTGRFSYDSNKISKEEIAKNINGIAGGELYKVTQNTSVDAFSSQEIIQ